MQKNKKDWSYIGIFIITLIILFLVICYIIYLNKFIKIPECVVYKNLGIYCPGCGGTRAVFSLYYGDVLKSIYYNPFVLFVVIIDFWYLISEGIAKILKKENKFFVKNINIYLYLSVIVLLVNWIIKIIMLNKGIRI